MIDRSCILFRQERAVWLKHLVLFVVFAQWPSRVWLFVTPSTVAHQSSLSFTNSQSLPKFMFISSVVHSSHLILWCPLLLLPSIFPRIRDFSNESSVHIRWPKYWSFSFSISPSKYLGLITFRIDWFDLLSKGLSRLFSSTTVWKHQFLVFSLPYKPTLTSAHDYCKNHVIFHSFVNSFENYGTG